MLKFHEKKARTLGMRLTEEEYQSILKLGKENKVSTAEMLAAIIRDYLAKNKL